MVIVLLSIISSVGIGLLPNSQSYNARLAADKWLTFFRLSQRISLVKQSRDHLVTVTVNQTDSVWQAQLTLDQTLIQQSDFDREGTVVKFSNVDFVSSCSALPASTFPQTYYFNGYGDHVTNLGNEVVANLRVCLFGGDQVEELCLSPSGFLYRGACVP